MALRFRSLGRMSTQSWVSHRTSRSSGDDWLSFVTTSFLSIEAYRNLMIMPATMAEGRKVGVVIACPSSKCTENHSHQCAAATSCFLSYNTLHQTQTSDPHTHHPYCRSSSRLHSLRTSHVAASARPPTDYGCTWDHVQLSEAACPNPCQRTNHSHLSGAQWPNPVAAPTARSNRGVSPLALERTKRDSPAQESEGGSCSYCRRAHSSCCESQSVPGELEGC